MCSLRHIVCPFRNSQWKAIPWIQLQASYKYAAKNLLADLGVPHGKGRNMAGQDSDHPLSRAEETQAIRNFQPRASNFSPVPPLSDEASSYWAALRETSQPFRHCQAPPPAISDHCLVPQHHQLPLQLPFPRPSYPKLLLFFLYL